MSLLQRISGRMIAIVFASVITVAIAFVFHIRGDSEPLMVFQSVIMAIEVPTVVFAAIYLIRDVSRFFATVELEVGVINGVKGSNEIPDGPFEKLTHVDRTGQFTLLFRNKSGPAFRDFQLRISAKDASSEPFRLAGIDQVHVKSETEYKTLKTTEEWSYLAPNVIMPLSLERIQIPFSQQEPITCHIRIEITRSSLRQVPDPYTVTVIFDPFELLGAIII